ncbi:MAG TPA: methyl-accepting chemotaxis protein [Candidatus Udaeobacter sp.]|nr:methyl-accepting chemotaxis protein [Candidatus Udaeobacter sp.]
MALEKPAPNLVDGGASSAVRVLQLTPIRPADGLLRVPQERLWNSFFARMLIGLLAVALPFFIIAGLVPNLLAPFGIGPQIVAVALLIGVAGLTARFMIRPVLALSQAAARVESGDLSVRVSPAGSAEIRVLGRAFNSMLERLAGIQVRIRDEVVDAASRLALAAQELAGATLEQTTAASLTSASMEELSRSAVSIAVTVAGVNGQAADIRTRIASAQIELGTSLERVHALSQSVGEIDRILVLINDIADETNLLALNAAIEAARAGESGRGFAVVADEVRRLAERSKTAAAQIGTLVGGAQTQTEATVAAVEERQHQMEIWLSMVVKMADASGVVQRATEDQRFAVDQAVGAIEQIAISSRSVSETAQSIALAAARQEDIAAELASSTSAVAVRGRDE